MLHHTGLEPVLAGVGRGQPGQEAAQGTATAGLGEPRGDVDERQQGRCRSCAWLIRAMAYDGRGDRDSAIALYERYANRLDKVAVREE